MNKKDATVFDAWTEDWEAPLLEKNDTLVEEKLLRKGGNLVLWCPDDEMTHAILDRNVTCTPGRRRVGMQWLIKKNAQEMGRMMNFWNHFK